ncbi:MAG: DUF4160 domain-containing protein, partial [Thermodesulfobacteriota bacterium]|nr:DUF4160 domain-containing protein [Thermodesulfobacteriota bacterium]
VRIIEKYRQSVIILRKKTMPEISRFFGIIIAIYYDDHNPPHFHARYGGQKVSIEIQTLKILDGEIFPRALGLVIEWAALHKKRTRRSLGIGKK